MQINKNNYIHRTSQILIASLLVLVLLRPQMGNVSAREMEGNKGDAYQVISLVNQVRAGYGLSAYEANSALMSAAQAHSEYQASIGSITHTGSGGSRVADRAVAAGYGGGTKVYVTENIYGGRNASAQTAVSWWQGDATHLNTIISPSYTDVGVGVAEANGTVYYTMDAGYVSGSPAQNSTSKSSSNSSTTSNSSASSSGSVIVPVMAATPQADGSIIHTVQTGQALWNIAAIYDITITDLVSLNGLTENSFIHPGDKILVRAATTVTATQTITATQAITLETSTMAFTPTDTQIALVVAPNTATLSPVIMESDTPTPTTVEVEQAESSSSIKVDPVLLIIGGLVVVGLLLVVLGSVTRRPG